MKIILHLLSLAKNKSGFSLVEVVLALGVVSFSSLVMVGLLGVGISSFQSSEQLSLSSKIREQVVGDLTEEGWSGVMKQYFSINTTSNTNPTAWLTATAAPQTFTYDEYGNLLTGTSSTATPMFKAVVTPSGTASGPAPSGSLVQFQIQISRVGIAAGTVTTYTAFVAEN